MIVEALLSFECGDALRTAKGSKLQVYLAQVTLQLLLVVKGDTAVGENAAHSIGAQVNRLLVIE